MPRLSEQVVHILSGEGLEVEEDRGGYLLRTGPGETPLSVWINETDRVVRAEQVLAYPVDDFSPSLGQALDWLLADDRIAEPAVRRIHALALRFGT
jgi:hypothetical protein